MALNTKLPDRYFPQAWAMRERLMFRLLVSESRRLKKYRLAASYGASWERLCADATFQRYRARFNHV